MFEILKQVIANTVAEMMPEIPQPKPALPASKWVFLGETSEKRRYTRCDERGKIYHLRERPVKVFTYSERNSKYGGAALREIRARNGVGRPPKNRRLH